MADLRFPEYQAPVDPCNLPVRRCTVAREQASHRILIQRNGAHGDILMATPLLTALRSAWPDAHITWIVERKEAPSIDAHPIVDEILLWDSSYWKRMIRRGALVPWLLRCLQMRHLLKERNYNIFISFQPEEWQLLARGCGASTRIGVFDTFRQFSGETTTSRNARFYTRAFTYEELPLHRTDQYLLPLNALDLPLPMSKQMEMGFTAQDREVARELLENHGLLDRPVAVLAPMTTWPSRCWSAERFTQLGDRLHDAGMGVVYICSPKEKDAVEPIARAMRKPPALAAGTLGFREMAALIAQAAVLVSGDTGPMHVAAAVSTPYVALFGPTPVAGRAPLAGKGTVLMHPVPCGPCDKKICPNKGDDFLQCMRLITVDEAYRAIQALLGQPVAITAGNSE